MFKHLSLWNIDAKVWKDIPDQFLMTKDEMLHDLMNEYMQPDSEMSWDDFCNEVELIEGMFEENDEL